MKTKAAAEHLSKVFLDGKNGATTEALRDINLEIYSGEFLCLVGPSGCGKTTLLRIIAGLEMPSSGTFCLDGSPVTAPGPERGLVFQEFALFPWRTVAENIAFGPEIRGISEIERQRLVQKHIEMVRLVGCDYKYPAELSGGMKQRVAIARALANNPEVLLMDEPFGSLDAQTRDDMQLELLRIWQETKKTIIFVTHNVDEALFLADRVVTMSARPGKIEQIMKINLKHPRDRLADDFISYKKKVLLNLPRRSKNP